MNDNLHALSIGSELNHYVIEAVLGSGGFGIVYKAHHAHLDEQVVIKEFLPVELAGRHGNSVAPHGTSKQGVYNECLRRFMEEGRTLVKLRHPNVVRCRDLFTANGTAYLVMDFEDGLPLDELVRSLEAQGSRYTEQQLLHFLKPLADGLAYIHSQGVLHRDIKPANVFIRRSDGSPVIIDFGAAKQNFALASQSQAPFTEFYAPLEQIEGGGEAKPTVDIHAFGGLMYRLATGQMGPKAEARAMALVYGKPDPLPKAAELAKGHYSETFLTTIDQCLAFKADERPQTMEAVKAMLSAPDVEAVTPTPPQAEPVKQTETVKQPAPVKPAQPAAVNTDNTVSSSHKAKPFPLKPVAAVVLVAMLGVAGWQYQQYSAEQERIATEKKRAEQQAKTQASNKQQQIVIAQQWLIKLGYTLTETGELDTRTKVAIQDFEKVEKLLVTGDVDATLLSKLEEAYWRKDKEAFDAAQKASTEQSYRNYLANWADGKYRKSAEQGLADIAAALAKAKNAAEEKAKRDAIAKREAEEQAKRDDISRPKDNAKQDGLSKHEEDQTDKGVNPLALIGKMVLIPGGTFNMGCSTKDIKCMDTAKPLHEVNVKDFKLMETEATFDLWDACVAAGSCYRTHDNGWGRGKRPVIYVSFNNITQQLIPWLNKTTGQNFRLPSEAEWEYAARAGSASRFYWGDNISCQQAHFGYQSDCAIDEGTLSVGSHNPNHFGLYNMFGNVSEWTQDCWNKSYKGAPEDSSAFLSGDCSRRMIRGGSWRSFKESLRTYGRANHFVVGQENFIGFRLAQDMPNIHALPSTHQDNLLKAAELTPIVRIEPRYPAKAARDGITGWVNLRFTVTESGSVDNIEVIGAEPAGVFDSEAIRALQRWKYAPKVEDGKAVSQHDVTVKLDFKLM